MLLTGCTEITPCEVVAVIICGISGSPEFLHADAVAQRSREILVHTEANFAISLGLLAFLAYCESNCSSGVSHSILSCD